MIDNRSHTFEDPIEMLAFIKRAVSKYIGVGTTKRILRSYNRLTLDELSMAVFIKVYRSTKVANKAFIRQAVIYVCIDEYRKNTECCPLEPKEATMANEQELLEAPEELSFHERLMTLKIFSGTELAIIELMIEGHRNPEIREILKIPKMTYYTVLNQIKIKYIDMTDDLAMLDLILNNSYRTGTTA